MMVMRGGTPMATAIAKPQKSKINDKKSLGLPAKDPSDRIDDPEGECPLCKKYGHVPNAETIRSFKEFEAGQYKSFKSIKDLMEDLNA
jgi:hypothetical protein